ncbi:MAG: hypothetical protein QMD09_07110 [Desulfatibacillaceae bacterium]|nr:hypothetical protein [Desulfatibacillaceae bacterium]
MKKLCFAFVSAALLLAACLIPCQALAGWEFTESTANGPRQVFVENQRIRMEEGRRATVYDAKSDTLVFLDNQTKKYWAGTPEQCARELSSAREQAMLFMERELATLPAQEREKARAILARHMPQRISAMPRVSILATDRVALIAGHQAKAYEMRVNGRLSDEIWISPEVSVKEDMDMKAFGRAMQAINSVSGQALEMAAFSPEVMDLLSRGWALQWVTHLPDGKRRVDTVTEVEKKAIDPGLFTLPKDFEAAPLEQVLAD